MPERLAIPGFLRGSRWTARSPGPRYCVLYEVADPAVLDSAQYRERLDHPTPWTSDMMKHYVGMSRTLCSVLATSGNGLGAFLCLIRFTPQPDREAELHRWLADSAMPSLSQRPGLAACYLLGQAAPAAMTREQQIRGRDASARSSLFMTGYDAGIIALLADELSAAHLCDRGAMADGYAFNLFQQSFSLASTDLSPRRLSPSSPC